MGKLRPSFKVKCSALQCENKRRFSFPKNEDLNRQWLEAIHRPEFTPKVTHGLCINHFSPECFEIPSDVEGYDMQRIRLKKSSIPNPILCSRDCEDQTLRNNVDDGILDIVDDMCSKVKRTDTKKPLVKKVLDLEKPLVKIKNEQIFKKVLNIESQNLEGTVECEENLSRFDCNNECFESDKRRAEESLVENVNLVQVSEETVEFEESVTSINSELTAEQYRLIDQEVQTDKISRYNIEQFKHKPQQLLHFTGLESYEKFMLVLHTLGPRVYEIPYIGKSESKISTENQFFLVLWKLRRSAADIELAEHFGLFRKQVLSIFKNWIHYMAKTWSVIDTWPSKDLINYYRPYTFKKNFPKVRGIIDGTEIKVEGSKNPRFRQSLFSHYKNSFTLKTLITVSPSGLISDASDFYGGSTSDRQIVERSGILKKVEAGDEILGDRAFQVQDLFASHDVKVSIPTSMKGRNHLSHKTVMNDRKLARHRVHVERVIGLLKTFTILSKRLNKFYVPISTEILQVCVMLTNFKKKIMPK